MSSQKYIITDIYKEKICIKIKEIEVFKKTLMAPPNIEKDSKLYYFAKIIPEKIICILKESDYKYLKVSYKDESFEKLYAEYNKKVNWDIYDGNLVLNNFEAQFKYKEGSDGFKSELEDVIIKPSTEVFSLETFVDDDEMNPFILEFETDEDAKLFCELNKNDYEKDDD